MTFYIRNSILHLRLQGNVRISTGVYTGRHKVSLTGETKDRELQVRINKLKEKIGNLQTVEEIRAAIKEKSDRNGLLLVAFAEFVELMANQKIENKKGRPYNASTVANYSQACEHYRSFVMKDGDINLRNSSNTDVTKHLNEFRRYLASKNLSVSTQLNRIEKLSHVISWFSEEENLGIQFSYNVPPPQVDRIFIEPEQIKAIFDFKDIPEDLYYYYMIAVTILSTTLRISDAVALDKSHINGRFLTRTNTKTQATTETELPTRLLQLYDKNIEKYGDIYPPCKRPDFKRGFPKLFKLIPGFDIHHSYTVYDSFGKANGRETNKLFALITPHVLRRSAITAMLIAGVDERSIRRLSGHSARSRSFECYVGYVESHHKSQVNKYLSTL